MKYLSLSIVTLINFFRVIINIKFAEIFFDKDSCSLKSKIIACISFAFITNFAYLYWKRPVINIICNVICIFLLVCIYEGSLKKKIFLTITIYFTNMVCDVFVVFIIFGNYSQSGYMLGQSVCTVLLIGICEIFIKNFVSLKTTVSYTDAHWRILLIVPISSIFVIHIGVTSNLQGERLIGIQSIGLLLINLASFYLYTAMENTFFESIEKEIYLQASKHYKEQLNIITHTQEEIRSLQHDLKFHIRELAVIAQKSDANEMLEYLNNLQRLASNPKEIVFSGNMEIDGNLNYYLNLAREKLIDVQVDLAIPEETLESFHDVNILIANLLENAIAAAENTNDKKLIFNMKLDRTLLYIFVENSYIGSIINENNYIQTSKRNKSIHGYGLKNVEKIVNNYNGTLNISYKENIFRVNVMVYVNI